MRLILLGPPGAGKGTQAKLLTEQFKVPHISTGDIFRDQMREKSNLGNKVAKFVKSGELVPDDIVVEMVIKRLTKSDAQAGFILDGFPRTLAQAEALNNALNKIDMAIDLVIYFDTSQSISIKRLSGRRVCKECGANFHLTNMPPKKEGRCDFCEGELFLREDDQVMTIKKRLKIYAEQTASLINYYHRSGILRKISGDWDAEHVRKELLVFFTQERLGPASNDKD